MKILSVATSDRGGGAERSAWLHFEGYRKRGHDSWLAVGDKKSHDERVVALHQSPYVDYRPYGRPGFRLALAAAKAADQALGREDLRHPYSHHLLELTGARPDVLHLHNLHGGYFDLRLVPRFSQELPVFLSVHDLWGLTDHRRKADVWRRSRLRVIATCEWARQQIEGSILEPGIEEIRVIPNAADLEPFEPGDRAAARRRLGVPDGADVVLVVANLGLANPYKDGATARAAIRQLAALRPLAAHRQRRDLQVLVVGGLNELADETFEGIRIRQCGYVAEPEELAGYYQAADVLLHATRQDLLPFVLIEALACELPVVASAVGGIGELVKDGETGRLFATGDAEAAARALAWSLDHREEAHRLALRGSRLVHEHHDLARTLGRTLAWMEEAVAADARRAERGRGATVHYGPRGALRHRAKQALRTRPLLYKAARRLHHAPDLAIHLAVRGLGLTPRIGRLSHHAPRPLELPTSYAAAREPLALPPVISIVTPSLDQGRFLGRTLASVLDQGYPALEYVVQDGGSGDETPEVLAAFADRLHHVESGPDGGQAEAIDRGFERTSGEIMAWLNADDVLLPGALDHVARHFVANPDVDVVYGHRVLIDEDDAEVGRWILPEHDAEVLRWVDFVPQETLFWRRRAWEKVGSRLDESLQFAVDWDLLLRFARADLTIERLPRFLGGFRVHPAQKTSALPEIGREEVDRLRRRELGFAPDADTVHRRLWWYYAKHLALHASFRLGLAKL